MTIWTYPRNATEHAMSQNPSATWSNNGQAATLLENSNKERRQKQVLALCMATAWDTVKVRKRYRRHHKEKVIRKRNQEKLQYKTKGELYVY